MFNGGKAVAAYLGREERTAMRWATERGLPVHRAPGRGRGTVYALREEIDAWLAADRERRVEARRPPETEADVPASASRRPRRRWREWLGTALIAGGLLLLAAGVLARWYAAPQAADEEPAFTDAAAKAHYLQATYDWNQRTRDSLQRAVREYGEAIARDPRTAASYVGLANSYLLLREYGSMPDAEAYARAEAAARTAIAQAPRSASAHRSLAFVEFWWRQDRPVARREFARALALRPADPLTHHWFATALSANGEQAAALREIERARDLDPTAPSVIADEGLIAYLAGRRGDGVTLLRRIESAQPNAVSPHRALADIALWEGRPADFIAEATTAARLRGDTATVDTLRRLRPAAGTTASLTAAMLNQTRGAMGKGGWFHFAQLASLNGRRDLASMALTRSCAAHEGGAIGARGDLFLSRSLDHARVAATCGKDLLE